MRKKTMEPQPLRCSLQSLSTPWSVNLRPQRGRYPTTGGQTPWLTSLNPWPPLTALDQLDPDRKPFGHGWPWLAMADRWSLSELSYPRHPKAGANPCRTSTLAATCEKCNTFLQPLVRNAIPSAARRIVFAPDVHITRLIALNGTYERTEPGRTTIVLQHQRAANDKDKVKKAVATVQLKSCDVKERNLK